MSIWGNKPAGPAPAPAPRPGVPTSSKLVMPWSSKPTPKPGTQPVVKPDFFKGGGASVKKTRWGLIQDARMGKLVIPGTGGKKMTVKQVQNVFKDPKFSYGKIKSTLDRHEAVRILKQMRHEDGGSIMSEKGRARRTFEQKWGLKSGKDY